MGRRLPKSQRIFPDHRDADAVAHRRYLGHLARSFDLATPLLRHEASRVALLKVIAQGAAKAFFAADAAAREPRKPHRKSPERPSEAEVERLARRQGLADQSYQRALDMLRSLCAEHQRQHKDDHAAAAPDALLRALQ